MKISVITATYNCGETLGTTLESMAAQTHGDIEHIVMDGGSKDDTMDMVRAWTAHPIRWESGKDKGIYDALNKGVACASGDIVGFLHADDVLEDREVLARIAKAFEDPSVQAVYGDLVLAEQEDIRRVIRYWRAGEFDRGSLKRGWMPPHPTVYLRRSLFDRVGPFDLRYRIAADYDWLLRMLKLEDLRLAYLPSVLVRMRVGGISNRSLRNILLKSSEDLAISRKHDVGGLTTIALKNLSKLGQFWARP